MRAWMDSIPAEFPAKRPDGGHVHAYTSRTGTRDILERLRVAGWRLLVSAASTHHQSEGFPYAIDNGAWTYHQKGVPFDDERFRKLVRRMGANADFIVVPDIVGGGLASLRLSARWLNELHVTKRPLLIPVQEGMEAGDVRPFLGSDVGIFVGGIDADWKEQTSIRVWGPLAREVGCYLHVGRVNSVRRIRICQDAGASSFDGTSPLIRPFKLGTLDKARRQGSIFAPVEPS